jgi:hypothetical protein
MGHMGKKERKEKGEEGVWCYTGEEGWHIVKPEDTKAIVTVDNSVHGGAG